MLYAYNNASIKNLFVHRVGNKSEQESCSISEKAVALDAELEDILLSYFLKPFKTEQLYNFYHDANIDLNEVYTYASEIFKDISALGVQSKNIANHLYNCSDHPKIKPGELYVVVFKDCIIHNEHVEVIGIFKTENKDTFLEVQRTEKSFNIDPKEGIDIKKIDKGCLIFNTDKENGYLVSIVDNTNKGNEAQYWKDDFLKVLIKNNEYYQTEQFLHFTNEFVNVKLEDEFEVSKVDKIDFLNRSVNYFKTHAHFEKTEFEEAVFQDTDVIEVFNKYNNDYKNEHLAEFGDAFNVSKQAVKKQARNFKSVLKLDKNFHVYIHGNRDMIEQGVDENGNKFYKLYYNSES